MPCLAYKDLEQFLPKLLYFKDFLTQLSSCVCFKRFLTIIATLGIMRLTLQQ